MLQKPSVVTDLVYRTAITPPPPPNPGSISANPGYISLALNKVVNNNSKTGCPMRLLLRMHH